MNICRENPNLVKIGQKYRTLYMKTYVSFIVAGDIISPLKHSLRENVIRLLEQPKRYMHYANVPRDTYLHISFFPKFAGQIPIFSFLLYLIMSSNPSLQKFSLTNKTNRFSCIFITNFTLVTNFTCVKNMLFNFLLQP